MDRNPSPPQVSENDETTSDIVGITGSSSYNQTFVLNALRDLLTASECTNAVLDDDLESRLCCLWDMTTEKATVQYMLNCDVVNIIVHVVKETENARLAEIAIGICGNILCALTGEERDEDRVHMSESDCRMMKATIMSIMSCRDTPTLTEAVRALRTALETRIWRIESEEEAEACLELNFIIGSTMNGRLLHESAQCLDLLLDQSDQFRCGYCKAGDCVVNAIEGIKQAMMDNQQEAMASLFHILYQLGTHTDSAKLIRKDSQLVFSTITEALFSTLSYATETGSLMLDQLTETHWSLFATALSIWTLIFDMEWKRMNAGESNFDTIASIIRDIIGAKSADICGENYQAFLTELKEFNRKVEVLLNENGKEPEGEEGHLCKIVNAFNVTRCKSDTDTGTS